MSAREACVFFVILNAWLAIAPQAEGHRLDEYLQATLLSVDTKSIDLEIDLTPGIALASKVFSWVDTNGDSEISDAEGQAYARQMLHSVMLSVDGRPAPVTLTEATFPPFRAMSLGVGIIRLKATAKVRAAGAGRHQVTFLNMHRPESSVYLVNALVPASPRIQIADQKRDTAQHSLTLDYTVMDDPPTARTFALVAGLLLAGRGFVRARRSPSQ